MAQKLTNRNSITSVDGNTLIHVVKDNVSYKIRESDLFGNAIDTLETAVTGLSSGYQGILRIADTPTSDGYYLATESGTYTNAGSIIVDLEDGMTFINVANGQTQFYEIIIPVNALAYNIVYTLADFDSSITAATSGQWIIADDIALDGNKTLPFGVTLNFLDSNIDLNTYTLTGDNTKINAGLEAIFSDNGTFAGTWEVKEVHPEWFGAAFNNSSDDYAAIQKALDFAKLNGTRYVLCPSGIALVSASLSVEDCILKGQGGLISETTIEGTFNTGNVINIVSRSSGVESIRIDASSARRSGGTTTDGGLFISGGDVSFSTCSRTFVRDVYITNQPGFGFYAAGNPELADWRNVTVQSTLGHALILDDGTFAGWANKQERIFEVTFESFRALECGGNILIGNPSQTSLGQNVRFISLEALGCAWKSDPGYRISEYQVIAKCQNLILDRPDIEDQQYASSTDLLGNSRTALAAPAKGIDIQSSNVTIDTPYFSSIQSPSINVSASLNNVRVINPTIFGGIYETNTGTKQADGIIVPGSGEGFRFQGSDQSGATNLLKNQQAASDITINGRKQYGLNLSTKDFDIDPRPQSATISSGTLDIDGKMTDVTGQGDVADSLSTIRIASGVNGYYALECYLFNKNAYDITVTNSGNIVTKTGASVVMNSSLPVMHFVFNDNDSKWYEI